MDLYGELEWRGLVYDATEGLRDLIARESLITYIGFDPTAASLHVGSLLPMVTLARLQRAGHPPIAVVGGGTGMIGDPSGKTAERQLLTSEQVEANVEGIRVQLSRFLDFESQKAPARLVNNAEWLTKLGAIDFMRDVGKHFTVNAMLAKDSVKRRIESEEGITYTEFSYSLLQAYDFLKLFDDYKCTLQVGGSDQWGNIVAGMELIRRVRGGKAHGLVLPLITTSSGTKFGKTEAGAVWLDPNLTSPFRFYQFWLNTEDSDAGRYLRYFTFLDRPTIDALEQSARTSPESREAQRVLARELTRMVHGETAVAEAEAATSKLFGGDIRSMKASELLLVFPNVPSSEVDFRPEGWSLIDLVSSTGATTSRSETFRLIKSGGLYVNDERVTDEKARFTVDEAIDGQLFVVRKGKKDNFLIKIKHLG
jgi:tyrosyl-tRNA synthetase